MASKITHLKANLDSPASVADPKTKSPVRSANEGMAAKVNPEVAFRVKFQQISSKIQKASRNLDDVLVKVKDEIGDLFEADRVTIYGIDGVKRELVSRVMTGTELAEIRIPVSPNSISGYAAYKQKIVNIADAYNYKELSKIGEDLQFDRSWDEKTGYRTKQVLACPIFFHKYLMGAIQLINRRNAAPFSKQEEKSIKELARIIGIAMYTQKRAARQRSTKFSHLLKKHLIKPKELERAKEEANKKRKTIEDILMEEFKISKEDILESYGSYYEVPTVLYDENALPFPAIHEGMKKKAQFLKKHVCVPLRKEENKIIIAIDDPNDLSKIDAIKHLFPSDPLEFHVALERDILSYINLFSGQQESKSGQGSDIDFDSLSDELMQGIDDDSEAEVESAAVDEESSAVVKLVNKIIIDSFKRGVSDIHIEPQPGKQDVRVRIRIDGSCQEYEMKIPYTYRAAIVSRIKIMSGLDIAERRLPQDGKIQFKKYAGPKYDIELRVATVPTQGGVEDIVMRILAAGEPIPLENMRFSKRNYEEFIKIITQPYGIIFVCGPTGSGKTTTLHSALKYINKVETKIWTAEDPVEITQKGLRQVQMHPKIGLTFARAMRAFLRADPDVIMVGEMRDQETTAIGIEASLTGHLVFSTLHTNSAPESVVRLLDMGMDPFNFADALLGILAQRLGRTLCKNCKEEYHPTREEYDTLAREYNKELFERDMAKEYPYDDNLRLCRPVGCEQCNGTGYKGRIAIHELMIGTDDIKRMIQTETRVAEMQAQAIKDGMRTLKQDGIQKVFMGYTDLAHIRKVCIN